MPDTEDNEYGNRISINKIIQDYLDPKSPKSIPEARLDLFGIWKDLDKSKIGLDIIQKLHSMNNE